MSGGDSRLRVGGGGGIGQVNDARAIDANSTRAGDFTEARNVGGEPVFLTKAGAAAYDALRDESVAIRAEHDPRGLVAFLLGDPLKGKEEFSGKTK